MKLSNVDVALSSPTLPTQDKIHVLDTDLDHFNSAATFFIVTSTDLLTKLENINSVNI